MPNGAELNVTAGGFDELTVATATQPLRIFGPSAIDLRRLRLVHPLEVTFPATLADAEIVLVKQ
jgi:hypothetical protein